MLPSTGANDAKAGNPNGDCDVHWQGDSERAGEGSQLCVADIADRVAALQCPCVTHAAAAPGYLGNGGSDTGRHGEGHDKREKRDVKQHREEQMETGNPKLCVGLTNSRADLLSLLYSFLDSCSTSDASDDQYMCNQCCPSEGIALQRRLSER